MKTYMFVTITITTMTLGLLSAAQAAVSAPLPLPPQAEACIGCHGTTGNSENAAYPHLAGQPWIYIAKQLQAYHDKKRTGEDAEAFMWPFTSELTKEDMKTLAKYFSSQVPTPNHEKPSDQEKYLLGEEIFNRGFNNKNYLRCSICHGLQGEGEADIPKLAGQFKAYVAKGLYDFRSNARYGNPGMHAVAKEMTDRQIEAVSEYIYYMPTGK